MSTIFLASDLLQRVSNEVGATELITSDEERLLESPPKGDRLCAMKLSARFLFAALTVSICALSPIAPAEVSLPNSDGANCCATQNTDRCHSCPATVGDTNSSASSCCVPQSGCCTLYFTRSTTFSSSMNLLGIIGVNDQHVTTRTERPLIPPPRIAFS